MSKPHPIQVGRAAEHYVVAEIHRRGGWAARFGGNMPKIDVLATNHGQTRKVTIQVKAKFGGFHLTDHRVARTSLVSRGDRCRDGTLLGVS